MILRRPDFGNSFRVNTGTAIVRNLSGQPVVYRNPNRPVRRGFLVTFTTLNQTQINDFKAFILASHGQIINWTDYEGTVWQGFIPDQVITIQRNRGTCDYSCSFSFEGKII